MIGPPEIRFLERGGRDFAYQVAGRGTQNVVNFLELTVHLDLLWTDPSWAQQFDRFEDLWRMLLFQARGVGLSEPVERPPTLEEHASDIEALMNAAEMDRAIVFASFTTAPPALVFAAAHPERVEALLLLDPLISGAHAADPDLTGWQPGEAERYAAGWLRVADRWGSGDCVRKWDPPIVSTQTLRQVGLLERTGASRSAARAFIDAAMRADVSRIVKQVRAPTHVLHVPTNPLPEAVVRHVADLIPAGEFYALPPSLPGMSWGESFIPCFEHVATLVTGRAAVAPDRQLATVLFEDVVGSTDLVSRIGDAAWRDLRVQRDRLVAICVEEHDGVVVSTAGDGSMSSFPGPAKAVRCAERLHQAAGTLDLPLRIGIHTGECERVGKDLSGLAVHIAARIGAAGAPGETLVSRTVADLVAGSGLRFEARGARELKGVPGTWDLLAVAGEDATACKEPIPAPAPRLTDRLVVATARRAPRVLSAFNRLERARGRRHA
jgi:class 3 adenylate cyclase/pimeloyl-ACP methyl ester carboxylesterase